MWVQVSFGYVESATVITRSLTIFSFLAFGTLPIVPYRKSEETNITSRNWNQKMHFSCHKSNKRKESISSKNLLQIGRNTFDSQYFLSAFEKTIFFFLSFQEEKTERIFRCLNWGSDNNRLLKLKAHVNRNIKRYMHSLFRVTFYFFPSSSSMDRNTHTGNICKTVRNKFYFGDLFRCNRNNEI